MSTSKETVAYVLGQLEPLDVRARSMFGEYAVYCDGKVVGFVCDDTLLVKVSDISAEYAADLPLGRPYPDAKDYHAVPEERIDDVDWLQEFIQRTADVLPAPKPRKSRARKQ
ncbi:TfoX/Sxy family protein [Rhodococcus spelaei]|uniref:TfoX/Sxy family protein n=1 Tax=Rhodococcus spelaei TaxID=2546320 RepID=A0A541BMQ3_9NOCA|nr:TfoX/Sxy family protein [Rhodococcus spelaei]TQF73607.1 TfoX/Sxy family protein [Rhodococcus spelaei]